MEVDDARFVSAARRTAKVERAGAEKFYPSDVWSLLSKVLPWLARRWEHKRVHHDRKYSNDESGMHEEASLRVHAGSPSRGTAAR